MVISWEQKRNQKTNEAQAKWEEKDALAMTLITKRIPQKYRERKIRIVRSDQGLHYTICT
jgi:hypothetical protein